MTKKTVPVTEFHRIRIIEHNVVGELYYEVLTEYKMFNAFWVTHEWSRIFGMLKIFISYEEAEKMSEIIKNVFLQDQGKIELVEFLWFVLACVAAVGLSLYFHLYTYFLK